MNFPKEPVRGTIAPALRRRILDKGAGGIEVPERSRLDRDFFDRPVLIVARELLGQVLVRVESSGERLSGRITETEAYCGSSDLGCHAKAGRTARNAPLWGPPGHAYVYFTYGMHWLLNVVAEPEGSAAAVLLRAVEPLEGLEWMRRRRRDRALRTLTDGPAKLCQAFDVGRAFDGYDLCAPDARLFLEAGEAVTEHRVLTGPRVGLNSVPEPWKSIPWRFREGPDALADERGR
jgi:DNA-3-methyladenine glycosylase